MQNKLDIFFLKCFTGPDDTAHMMIVTWMVFFKSVFMLGVACHAKYFIAKNVAREFDTFSGLTGAMTRIKRLHTLSSTSSSLRP